MFLTRLAGGRSFETATLADALAVLQSGGDGPITHRQGPRGWRVETRRDNRSLYVGLVMQQGVHAMRSAHVDPQTGTHFWSYR